MKLFGLEIGRAEKRMITEIPGIDRPGSNILQVFGLSGIDLPAVTTESALSVPAVQAAVTFLSRSLAALPLHAYRNTEAGPEKIKGGLQTLVHEAPNREWTSFKLRQYFWQQVFTGGRGLLYIERAGSNITGLYPISPTGVQIKRDSLGNTTYQVGSKTFAAADVIDIPFMLKADGVGHYGPITMGAGAIQLALAMNAFGSKFFAGGGVPPLALVGPPPAGKEALQRALKDVQRSIETAREQSIPIANIPPGYELKPIGFDPEKGQMTDARRFQVEEIARVYGLSPIFLQDLTHGTFSNAEQQDLHVVKHCLAQWVQSFEEELNLKLFGQRNGGRYVEHNMDGLLRGDFKTRMEGLARAIQTAQLTPDEARALENRPAYPGGVGEKPLVQGATVPLGSQPVQPTPSQGNGDANDDGTQGALDAA
jgi:HK97 family phage portal protein